MQKYIGTHGNQNMEKGDTVKLLSYNVRLFNKYGWIPQTPVLFSPWVLSDDPALSKMTKRSIERGDNPNSSYSLVDTRDGRNIELFFYPPSKKFYNYKDLIKYIK